MVLVKEINNVKKRSTYLAGLQSFTILWCSQGGRNRLPEFFSGHLTWDCGAEVVP